METLIPIATRAADLLKARGRDPGGCRVFDGRSNLGCVAGRSRRLGLLHRRCSPSTPRRRGLRCSASMTPPWKAIAPRPSTSRGSWRAKFHKRTEVHGGSAKPAPRARPGTATAMPLVIAASPFTALARERLHSRTASSDRPIEHEQVQRRRPRTADRLSPRLAVYPRVARS